MLDARYAVYFAPHRDTALWRFGSGVLGYDAAIGADATHIVPHGFSELAWRPLVAEPKRYGFHATLKAPFHLAPGAGPGDLLTATSALASKLDCVRLGPLSVERIGAYLALVPATPPDALPELAQVVVAHLDVLRAPFSETERQRRRPDLLTPRQRELLERFGYPYVAEEFRFHMTLAGPFEDRRLQEVALAGLEVLFSQQVVNPSCDLDQICIFSQRESSTRFEIMESWPLRGSPTGVEATQ